MCQNRHTSSSLGHVLFYRRVRTVTRHLQRRWKSRNFSHIQYIAALIKMQRLFVQFWCGWSRKTISPVALSLRIRSSSIFIMNQFLQPILFSICNGEHCCILFHLVYRNAAVFTRGFLAKSDKNCTAVSGTQPKCGPLFKSAETCGGRRTILHFSALVLSAKSSILKIIIDVPAGFVPRPAGEGELL